MFTKAWTTAGASGSHITRLMGTGFSQSYVTQDVAGVLQLWGIPCDYVVLAPYFSVLQYNAIVAAASATDGNWPVDAYLDFVASEFTWNYYTQNTFAAHSASLSISSGWGQPSSPLGLTDAGGTSSNLPGGGYAIAYTYVDSGGHETTIGQSFSPGVGINNNETLTTQMPLVPPWVASINLYLGGSGNQGSLRLYGNYLASTTPGTTIEITSYNSGAASPPATNGAAASAGTPPGLGTYEGFPATIAPVGLSDAAWGRWSTTAAPTRRCGT